MNFTQLILLLSYISSNVCFVAPPQTSKRGSCVGVTCRPGRECLESRPGLAECACIEHCPDHWKPVCGSDGISYDSHCQLHRAACKKEKPISPLHSGFCREDREALIARQEFIQELSLWDQDKEETITGIKIPLPDACFQNDRDRLREFIINWFQISAKKQDWYSSGMSAGEELWAHFTAMNNQKGTNMSDSSLDSGEWLQYLNRNRTQGVKANKMRQLCLDALVEEGDTDYDWRLSFSEFRRILSSTYQPSRSLCHLNGKRFEDGAETAVECNGCVCACGKWICTSEMCPEGYQNVINQGDDEKEWKKYQGVVEDEDIEDNEEDPEDDPDVKDIRWF